jgi:hypothetical protein
MTRDEWLTVTLVVAFATLVTAHVTLVVGLLGRPPRWRALVAAVVAPLAPVWGMRAAMPVRAVIWVASAVAYGALRWLASK